MRLESGDQMRGRGQLTLLVWALPCLSKSKCGVLSFSFAPNARKPLVAQSASSHVGSSRQLVQDVGPLFSSSLPTPTQEQTLDDYLPADHPIRGLLSATVEACTPRRDGGAEAGGTGWRYEWGTWCDAEKLAALMEELNEVRLITGSYEELLDGSYETTLIGKDEKDNNDASIEEEGKATGKRIRIASDKYWDIILHVLPKGARYQGKWPEGSWTIAQPLIGLTEVAQLRGPDRDGYYSKMRSRDVRGGGDGSGSLGSGASEGAEGYSTAGETCIKYLGGPMRSFTGKAQKSCMLEVVVRPPIDVNIEATGAIEELKWESVASVLTRVVPKEESSEEEDTDDDGSEIVKSDATSATNTNNGASSNSTASSGGLNKKLGMDFDNVGGLDDQLDDIAVSTIQCCDLL